MYFGVVEPSRLSMHSNLENHVLYVVLLGLPSSQGTAYTKEQSAILPRTMQPDLTQNIPKKTFLLDGLRGAKHP